VLIEEREDSKRQAIELQQRTMTLEGQLAEAQARITTDGQLIAEMQET
jgi:hypothetical protein